MMVSLHVPGSPLVFRSMNPPMRLLFKMALTLVLLGSGMPAQAPSNPAVALARSQSGVRVTVDGKLFTEYRSALPRPCLWPVMGPGGVPMTRSWPLGTVREGEKKDHPHHTGVWFGHGNVNGTDFWHPQDKRRGGSIEVKDFLEDPARSGRIRVRNIWRNVTSQEIARDVSTISFGATRKARWIDWKIEVHASQGALRFGDTKEGTLAIRMHPALRLTGPVAKGKAKNSTGVSGRKLWGRRASWVDYFGAIDGRVMGIALFDHPKNPRYPTWWHARDYGLCAANPFGVHHFEKKKPGTGDLLVAAGKTVTFRWRLLFHEGTPEDADITAAHRAFAADETNR